MTLRDLTDRIAALDAIEPPPGWVERAINRFRRETMIAKVVLRLRELSDDLADVELSSAVARVPDSPTPAVHIAARRAVVDLVAVARLNPPRDMRSLPTDAGSLLSRAGAGDVAPDSAWRSELAKVWMPAPAILPHADLTIAYALCPGDDATERAVFHGLIAVIADAATRRAYTGPWDLARKEIAIRYARAIAACLAS